MSAATFASVSPFLSLYLIELGETQESAIVWAGAISVAANVLQLVAVPMWGALADRYGRRIPLIANLLFFSTVEVLCGFAPNYATFLDTARQAGLANEIGKAGSIVGFARPDGIHEIDRDRPLRSILGFRGLTRQSQLKLAKFALDVIPNRRRFSYSDLSKAAGKLDQETPEEYCRRRFNDEIFEYVVDSTVRGWTGASGTKTSNLDFVFSLAMFIGARYLVLEEGMSSYAAALARGLDTRTGTSVSQVLERPDHVEVLFRDHQGRERSEGFDGCVIAVQAPEAARLRPQLDEELAAFLRSVRYTSMATAHAITSRRPELRSMYVQTPRSICPGLIGIYLQHNQDPRRAPDGRGVVSILSTTEFADELRGDGRRTGGGRRAGDPGARRRRRVVARPVLGPAGAVH